MKTVWMFLLFFMMSCLVMITADYLLGARAEYLNAFSAMERLLGEQASAGDSLIARRFGATVELAGVLVVNAVAGGVLALLFRRFRRRAPPPGS